MKQDLIIKHDTPIDGPGDTGFEVDLAVSAASNLECDMLQVLPAAEPGPGTRIPGSNPKPQEPGR